MLKPAFWALAEIEVRARATEIISRAVRDHIAQEPVSVLVERDAQGRVMLVQPNIRMINALSSGAALAIQQDMRGLDGMYIEVPLGLLTGSYLFAGVGPRLKARILQVGVVSVDVVEQFESVGINQARHLVLLKADMLLRVVTPLESKDVPVVLSYPVSEVVFAGDVPRIMGIPR
jgi:sporulation protein YunB